MLRRHPLDAAQPDERVCAVGEHRSKPEPRDQGNALTLQAVAGLVPSIHVFVP